MYKRKPQRNDDMDRLRELEEYVEQKKIEDGVNKKIRTICITSMGSFLTFCGYMGNLAYEKSVALEAAIRAFWLANKGGGQ